MESALTRNVQHIEILACSALSLAILQVWKSGIATHRYGSSSREVMINLLGVYLLVASWKDFRMAGIVLVVI
jgi:hypothetical protein